MNKYRLILLAFAALNAGPVMAHNAPEYRPSDHAPAGVMADHMHEAGKWMLGVRHAYSVTGGDTLTGDNVVDDQTLADQGFSSRTESMVMNMTMLDIMYAPTDWLNVMLMPQFMDMDMTMKTLPASAHGGHGSHGGHSHGAVGSTHTHSSSGIGDLPVTALLRFYKNQDHSAHMGLGFSVPTGSVWERGSDGKMTHYGMQPGSGTWDFMPSLTYRGHAEKLHWGGQLNGIVRMEEANAAGYQLGDQITSTIWGGYALLDWLSASLRFQYMAQEKIEGHYNQAHNHSSPPDLQGNYGGQFMDVGFGFNSVLSEGFLAGHRVGIEWLNPVYESVNGVQQARTGTLFFNWSKAF